MTRGTARWALLIALGVLLGAAAGAAVASGTPSDRATPAFTLETPAGERPAKAPAATPAEDDTDAKMAAEDDSATAPSEDEPWGDENRAREALLEEWKRLNAERERLLDELEAVHGQMRTVAEQLWRYELDGARERLRDQLNEVGGVYGDDIVDWLPPRLIEHMAELTGRTPDEVREMLRAGAWGELL